MKLKEEFARLLKEARAASPEPSVFYRERQRDHAAPMIQTFQELLEEMPFAPWSTALCSWVAYR